MARFLAVRNKFTGRTKDPSEICDHFASNGSKPASNVPIDSQWVPLVLEPAEQWWSEYRAFSYRSQVLAVLNCPLAHNKDYISPAVARVYDQIGNMPKRPLREGGKIYILSHKR